MEQGWVKFYREWMSNIAITKDNDHLAVWIYLLTNTTYTEKEDYFNAKKITLKAGQLLCMQKDICNNLKLEPTKLRRILKLFKSAELIDYQTDNHKTLITLVVWDFSQSSFAEQNADLTPNQCRSNQETENEKEKSSKREKDKEKEINKNEKNERISIHSRQQSAASCQQKDDLSFPSEKDLDRWLNQGTGDRGQEIGNEADSFALANPIQPKKKEININSPQPPSCEANHGDTPPSPVTEMFDEFWKAYPKKIGKGYAFECFKKIRVSRSLLDTMLEAIAKQKKSDMWKRDKGQYIPNPSTWLNQKRWEDDLGGDTEDDGQIPWSKFNLGIVL